MACVVGIGGGSGSGKSTLAHYLERMFAGRAQVLELDWYYRDLAHETMDVRNQVNFDHPDALEVPRIVSDLMRLKRGEGADVPCYDFSCHLRRSETRRLDPVSVIIVEGILSLSIGEVREVMDLSVFVDTSEPLRRRRRIDRDVRERGRTVAHGLEQYLGQVLPMHERFVAPTRDLADYVVSGEIDVTASAAPIVDAIQERLPA